MLLPWILCGILVLFISMLFTKLLLLRKDLKEICIGLTEYTCSSSNTLLTVASNDKQIRKLAAVLNKQLDQLRKQRRQYIHGENKLKESVTSISHDLRTPLTAVCGYLDLLEQEEISDTAKRYIQIIQNRVELLNQLTEELFEYTVTLLSKNDTDTGEVVVNELIEESIAGFYAVLKKQHIEPVIKLPQKKIKRVLSASNLSRVMINLLHNAVKYSDGDLQIMLSEQGEIIFANTAAELDTIQVAKLFDRFYTVHNAENTTGLGLEISRTLICEMDGRMYAEYKENKLYVHILLPEVKAEHHS